MPNTLDALFNDRKVHVRLATLLFDQEVHLCHVDRYSLVEADGIATQTAVTSVRFAGIEPEVDAYRLLDPADLTLWNPSDPKRLRAEVRAAADAHGLSDGEVVWIRGKDVHPNCRHNQVVAALVLLGGTLFLRCTASAVVRAIRRADGADENAYTVLLCQIIRYHGRHGLEGLRRIRWDEDVTRGVRDDLSGATAVDAATDWGVDLQFGDGRVYDPQDANDRSVLNFIMSQGSADDVRRRKRLMGKRIAKQLNGGWGKAGMQLPPGYRLRRDDQGDVIRVPGMGTVPEPDPDAIEMVRELWSRHAGGESYVNLGRAMARLGAIRRSQKKCPTFQELVEADDRVALGEAAASFFTNAAANPHRDLETYLQKVHLLRTGKYRARVQNEIRGRGRVVNGIAAIPWDETDEYGYFPLETYWGWPINPLTGELVPHFGLTPAQIDASEKRILEELRPERRRPVGGQAHKRGLKRALRPDDWSDRSYESGVQPRMTNAGKFTDVILKAARSERENRRQTGSRGGWRFELQHPKTYIVGTYALSDLCGSASNDLRQQVELLIKSGNRPALLQILEDRSSEAEPQRRATALSARLDRLRDEHRQKSEEADDIDLLVARAVRKGDESAAARNEQRANALRDETISIEAIIADVQSQIDACLKAPAHDPAKERTVEANLTVPAYLVEGLRRAGSNNGLGSEQLAEVAREHLTDWRLEVTVKGIRWACVARIPLTDGSTATLQLSGVIDNVRLPQGGRHETCPDVLAQQIFSEGRTLEDVIAACHVKTSRTAHLDRRIMPWLRDNGVTSKAAKSALVDHPIFGVQQLVYSQITGAPTPTNWSEPLRTAILDYYTDPDAEGGFAACLDDTVPVQRVLTTLLHEDTSHDGIEIESLAIALGETVEYVRALANPPSRCAGARRPIFVEFHPDSRERIRLIQCTYCRGVGRFAGRALYLGEVARSGYGVVCECGRPPVPRDHPDHQKWRRIAFPCDFTADGLITRLNHSALTKEPQTAFVPMPPPLRLPHRRRGRRAS